MDGIAIQDIVGIKSSFLLLVICPSEIANFNSDKYKEDKYVRKPAHSVGVSCTSICI